MLSITDTVDVVDLRWQDDALCRQVDPALFFPEQGQGNANAKRVCLACPARAECLDYALDARIEWGIWGGLTERERWQILGVRPTPEVADGEKTCTICDEPKPLTAFNRDARSGDGHDRRCRVCINARKRELRDREAA